MKTEFVVQLIDASDLLKKVSAVAVSLLEQAECELELALDILEDVESDKAKRFVARHSTPARARHATESAVFDAPFEQKPTSAFITGETVTRKND
mgnify:FL=1